MINEKLIFSPKILRKEYYNALLKLNKDRINENETTKKHLRILANNRSKNILLHSFGFHSSDMNIIFINLKEIYDTQEIRNINQHLNIPLTFDELICETITHECIHSILEEMINYKVSCEYDNIYLKLRKNGIMG